MRDQSSRVIGLGKGNGSDGLICWLSSVSNLNAKVAKVRRGRKVSKGARRMLDGAKCGGGIRLCGLVPLE